MSEAFPETVDEIVADLKKRGMRFRCLDDARRHINGVSYYQLMQRAKFEEFDEYGRGVRFPEGTWFEDVRVVGEFEDELISELRMVTRDIEYALKPLWQEVILREYGPFGYLDPHHHADRDEHERTVNEYKDFIKRSKIPEALEFKRENRPGALPPVDLAWQIMSFHTFLAFLRNLRQREDREAVASQLEMEEGVLFTFFDNLWFVKRCCWNYYSLLKQTMPTAIVKPSKDRRLADAVSDPDDRRLYNSLLLIDHIDMQINKHFGKPIHNQLLDSVEACKPLDESSLGFPENWRSLEYWSKVDFSEDREKFKRMFEKEFGLEESKPSKPKEPTQFH